MASAAGVGFVVLQAAGVGTAHAAERTAGSATNGIQGVGGSSHPSPAKAQPRRSAGSRASATAHQVRHHATDAVEELPEPSWAHLAASMDDPSPAQPMAPAPAADSTTPAAAEKATPAAATEKPATAQKPPATSATKSEMPAAAPQPAKADGAKVAPAKQATATEATGTTATSTAAAHPAANKRAALQPGSSGDAGVLELGDGADPSNDGAGRLVWVGKQATDSVGAKHAKRTARHAARDRRRTGFSATANVEGVPSGSDVVPADSLPHAGKAPQSHTAPAQAPAPVAPKQQPAPVATPKQQPAAVPAKPTEDGSANSTGRHRKSGNPSSDDDNASLLAVLNPSKDRRRQVVEVAKPVRRLLDSEEEGLLSGQPVDDHDATGLLVQHAGDSVGNHVADSVKHAGQQQVQAPPATVSHDDTQAHPAPAQPKHAGRKPTLLDVVNGGGHPDLNGLIGALHAPGSTEHKSAEPKAAPAPKSTDGKAAPAPRTSEPKAAPAPKSPDAGAVPEHKAKDLLTGLVEALHAPGTEHKSDEGKAAPNTGDTQPQGKPSGHKPSLLDLVNGAGQAGTGLLDKVGRGVLQHDPAGPGDGKPNGHGLLGDLLNPEHAAPDDRPAHAEHRAQVHHRGTADGGWGERVGETVGGLVGDLVHRADRVLDGPAVALVPRQRVAAPDRPVVEAAPAELPETGATPVDGAEAALGLGLLMAGAALRRFARD